jgi:hypothetical protein
MNQTYGLKFAGSKGTGCLTLDDLGDFPPSLRVALSVLHSTVQRFACSASLEVSARIDDLEV